MYFAIMREGKNEENIMYYFPSFREKLVLKETRIYQYMQGHRNKKLHRDTPNGRAKFAPCEKC